MNVTEAHKQKACDLLNTEQAPTPWRTAAHGDHPVVTAFAKYIAEQEAAAKYPPELVDRMVELIGGMSALDMTGEGDPIEADYQEARAIHAALAALQVDPVEQHLMALESLVRYHERLDCVDGGGEPDLERAVEAIKALRGMELERSK